MKIRILVFISISLAPCLPLLAGDVTGAKDPMGLKRYEGTRITYYDQKALDAYDLPLGIITKIDYDTHKSEFEKSLKLEGKVTRVSYASSDPDRTSLEVYRNYKSELKAQGWVTLWEGSEAELSTGNGDAFAHLFHDRPGQTFDYSYLGGHFIAAKKGNAMGVKNKSVQTIEYDSTIKIEAPVK